MKATWLERANDGSGNEFQAQDMQNENEALCCVN